MRWKYESNQQKLERVSTWRKWFAWHSVLDNDTIYWLEFVERRSANASIFSGELYYTYQYRGLK